MIILLAIIFLVLVIAMRSFILPAIALLTLIAIMAFGGKIYIISILGGVGITAILAFTWGWWSGRRMVRRGHA